MVGLALCAFEIAAGIGKVIGSKLAVDGWMNRLGLTKPFMRAFGGLELGAIGVIFSNLFYKDGFNERLFPFACLLLLALKLTELFLQFRANEPLAAKVGPMVVIALTVAFYFLKQTM